MTFLFAREESTREQVESASSDGRNDFDFLTGSWSVRHRRLRRRLAGDTSWDDFGGRCASVPILGGLGNVDDNFLELPGGSYRATTLRLFDPASKLWSIWWIDSRAMRLEPPVRGRFHDGTGMFSGDDVLDDRPIKVRFIWSEIRSDSARWEQAFSADDGRNWETNWTMTFTRNQPRVAADRGGVA